MYRFLVFMFVLLLPFTASAACYNAAQLEAEQGLRIHSELMVIALNCQHLSKDVPLNRQYEEFTKKNNALIKGYEDTMRAYFKTTSKKTNDSDLNTFRTVLANRIANEAVRLQPNVFCRAYGSRVTQALNMDQANFRKWAQTVFADYPITQPICTGVAVRTQAKKK
jgi:hypothetical protein